MSVRNVWGHDETKTMLNFIKEENILKLFDGKIYKNIEIYKKIELELAKKGFPDKNHKQIETRWKNLKKQYIATKKNNNKSGQERKVCAFYEDLDEILGCRPSVSVVELGIDTLRDIEVQQSELEEAENSEASTSPSLIQGTPITGSGRAGKGSYAKCLEKLGTAMAVTQKEISRDFFQKQKELIDYEFNLYAKMEENFETKYNENTKNILQENTSKFLKGISELLQNSQTVFLSSFPVDD